MQNISLDHIEPSQLKNFLKKICIVNNRHAKEDTYLETEDKEMLRVRVQELEKELQQTREEKCRILKENRNKIDELNTALLSVKTEINELLQAKKEREMRVKNLEMGVRKSSRVN